jgi:hypothetical protein
MAALAFTSAVAPAALGRARRGARAGAARRAASVRAYADVSPDVDDDSTRSRRDDPDASPSRRGLLLGAGGLAVATTPGLILPGGASASPASSRVTLAALNQKRSVESGGTAGISGSSASSSQKYRYVAWSGSERNTVVGDGALSLSPMGVGTWSWGNQFVWGYDESNDPVLEKVFDRAVDAGVNLFDTADSYGTGNGLDGRSEVLIGEFLKRYPEKSERFSSPSSSGDKQEASKLQSEVNIASKFAPYPWRVTPQSITNAAKEERGAVRGGPNSARPTTLVHR